MLQNSSRLLIAATIIMKQYMLISTTDYQLPRYASAMLYGLNTSDPSATATETATLQQAYNAY